jgi:hypothetical protein
MRKPLVGEARCWTTPMLEWARRIDAPALDEIAGVTTYGHITIDDE